MTIYYVSSRYTAGSPAEVSRELAFKIAEEERVAYERALAGLCGGADKIKAEACGICVIVEQREERDHGWIVKDLLTERQFWRGTVPAGKVRRGDLVTGYVPLDFRPSRAPFVVDGALETGQDVCLVFYTADGGRDFVVLRRLGDVKIERGDSFVG